MALLGTQRRLVSANLILNSISQPKHRFIAWLATKERLLTKSGLIKLNIQVDDATCCLCTSSVIETAKHLFAECCWFKTIRQALLDWLGIHLLQGNVQQVFDSIQRQHWKCFQKNIVAAVWGALIYHTWRARNRRIFQGQSAHTERVITQIKQELFE
ncbi:uncharacterized protein LOC107844122 [Capsicum annuum]|uniref:uncharacterized protein LOC107844122 n=1 Tax=Capsicum annuum TaxID=4072 RepID=UPI0007BEDDAD|nr:uncharacterized protein LOC107844122 [Capsicum annuum]